MDNPIEEYHTQHIEKIWDMYWEMKDLQEASPDNKIYVNFNELTKFCIINSEISAKIQSQETNVYNDTRMDEDETYIIGNGHISIQESDISDEEEEVLDKEDIIDYYYGPVIKQSPKKIVRTMQILPKIPEDTWIFNLDQLQ